MKCSFILCLTAALLLAANIPGAAGQEPKESPLDAILREVKMLRSMVERMEKRIERLEEQQSQTPAASSADVIDLLERAAWPKQPNERVNKHELEILPIEEWRMSIEEWHMHEMPWKPTLPQTDKGLYIFE